MRTTIMVFAVLFAGSARAEISRSKPKTLPAGADICKEITAGGGTCAGGAKLKSKSLGKVSVYRVDGEQLKVTFAIDTGKETILATAFEDQTSNCGGGKCVTLTKATPTLREVKLGSDDAIALSLDLTYTNQLNEPPKTKTTWKRSTFIVCGKKSSASWSCITATYGGPAIPCTAALQKSGEVKYTCTASDPLSL